MTNLLFAVGLAALIGAVDVQRVVFDFPPSGTGAVLVLPLIGVLLTMLCVVLLLPVWRSSDCSVWQRIRYSYVTLVFVLLLFVMAYWNLIGWNY